MKYTDYNYRINTISENSGFNWIFLPGGPGLGSEYLIELCKTIKLPGTILLVDFPMDGTNKKGKLDINYWRDGLIDLLKSHDNCILVTHSFSGMLALTMPMIEKYLVGLVLMNTTTTDSFFQHVSEMHHKHDLPDLLPAANIYHAHPSNKTYKDFWITYKHYCFTPAEMFLGEKMTELFAFNNESYHYAVQHFYPSYECKLSPTILTMTITGDLDFICPPQTFINNEKFQSKNIINKIIPNAGHCSWLVNLEKVQDCFDDFIKNLNTSEI